METKNDFLIKALRSPTHLVATIRTLVMMLKDDEDNYYSIDTSTVKELSLNILLIFKPKLDPDFYKETVDLLNL